MSKQYLANSMKRGRPTLEAPISQNKIQTPTRVAGQQASISLFFQPLTLLPEKTPQTVGREAAFGGAAARSKLYSDPNQNCSDDDMPICGSIISQNKFQTPTRVAGQQASISLFFRQEQQEEVGEEEGCLCNATTASYRTQTSSVINAE